MSDGIQPGAEDGNAANPQFTPFRLHIAIPETRSLSTYKGKMNFI